ncbi:MAG: hypothetical protein IRY99_15580 [Isosphaeraceae bacterium]|nr:hypothetical protein [Isosphaeraceae bacterium]
MRQYAALLFLVLIIAPLPGCGYEPKPVASSTTLQDNRTAEQKEGDDAMAEAIKKNNAALGR